jgi:hypothetical protein
METDLKPGYFSYRVNARFITVPSFYFFYMPVPMSMYESFKKKLTNMGITIDWSIGMIESPRKFGMGWLGVAYDHNTTSSVVIEKDFIAYKMLGDYKQMRDVYKKIKIDYPNILESYHLYLTDPKITKMEDNITYILFTLK